VVNTFDSSERQASGEVPEGSGGVTSWLAQNLTDNQHYFWRAKASDGSGESDWVVGDFILDSTNEPPSVPTIANPGDRAWVSTQTPTFTVNPSTDPEGDAISYVFEVYKDAALSSLATSGTSGGVSWQPTTLLEDKTTHYWRVRAQDARGAASEWSPVMTLFVSTGTYVPPTIAVTNPSTITNAGLGVATITWTSTNPNIEPRIALYYDQTGSGYAGTKIVDGLRQNVGSHAGSYEWNMTGLPAGAYYVYGVSYDDRGFSQAYAPGTLVVPAVPQAGGIFLGVRGGSFSIREDESTSFMATLTRAPTSTVVVPISSSDTSEATVSPQQLTFTPSNWSRGQSITVSAVDDGVIDGDKPVEITAGGAISHDPHYIGVSSDILHGVVRDIGVTAGSDLSVAGYTLVSRTQVRGIWRYSYRITVRNQGPRVDNVTATVVSAPQGYAGALNSSLDFGVIGQNESATSTGTFSFVTDEDLENRAPDLTWRLQIR